MAGIYLDYNATRANARKMQQSADSCRDVSGGMKKLQGEIPGYWNGEASDMFVSSIAKWNAEMDKVTQEINAISAKIIRIANEFEAAEERIRAAAAASAASAATSAVSSAISAATDILSGGGGRF